VLRFSHRPLPPSLTPSLLSELRPSSFWHLPVSWPSSAMTSFPVLADPLVRFLPPSLPHSLPRFLLSCYWHTHLPSLPPSLLPSLPPSPGLWIRTIYGGVPYERQIRDLETGFDVLVGTPGRIMDHLDRGTLSLKDIK